MPHRTDLLRRRVLQAGAAALTARYVPLAVAADPFRIGLILPLSGPFASTGKQVDATQTGWSFDEPDADEVTLRFSW